MFKGRRILIEKSDDGHTRVVVLYRQVAQSDELLDYVSLPSRSFFPHISYKGRVPLVSCVYTYRLLSTWSRGSHHKLLLATTSPNSPPPNWNPPMCRFCNLLAQLVFGKFWTWALFYTCTILPIACEIEFLGERWQQRRSDCFSWLPSTHWACSPAGPHSCSRESQLGRPRTSCAPLITMVVAAATDNYDDYDNMLQFDET